MDDFVPSACVKIVKPKSGQVYCKKPPVDELIIKSLKVDVFIIKVNELIIKSLKVDDIKSLKADEFIIKVNEFNTKWT